MRIVFSHRNTTRRHAHTLTHTHTPKANRHKRAHVPAGRKGAPFWVFLPGYPLILCMCVCGGVLQLLGKQAHREREPQIVVNINATRVQLVGTHTHTRRHLCCVCVRGRVRANVKNG